MDPQTRKRLGAELEAFTPFDEDERAARDEILALVRDTAAPSARQQFAPGHLTASAFVLSPKKDALLFIHHSKLKRWLQPGGHVEPGETDLESAARREAAEETGLAELTPLIAAHSPGPFDLDVHVIPENPKKGEPAHKHFDVRYLFLAPHAEVEAGDDAEAAKFVPFASVATHNDEASIDRVLKKLRALALF